MSPVLDPVAWKQDAFQHPWDDLIAHALPPLHFSKTGLVESDTFDLSSSSLTSKGVVCRSIGSSGGGTS